MTEAVLDIEQWGNNLGVRLPAAVAREAHLRTFTSGFVCRWKGGKSSSHPSPKRR